MDIGSRLRQARVERGLSIADVAARTKVPARSLEAMETNAFERLPGGIYTRGFLKAYAKEIGLDGDRLADDYVELYEQDEVEPEPIVDHDQDATGERRSPWVPLAAAGILLALIVVSRTWTSGDQSARKGSLETPDAPVIVVPAGEPSDDTPVATSGSSGGEKALTDADQLTLELEAIEPCWVSLNADGARALYRVLQPGERERVTAENAFTMTVGNAGGLVLTINGVAGRPLGRPGQVVTIRIDRTTLRELVASTPPPAAVAPSDH